MSAHHVELDGSTTWADEDLIRQRFHCSGCDLVGILHVHPVKQLDEMMTALRAAHEGERPIGI